MKNCIHERVYGFQHFKNLYIKRILIRIIFVEAIFLKTPSNINSKLNFFFSFNAFPCCYGMMIYCIMWYDVH